MDLLLFNDRYLGMDFAAISLKEKIMKNFMRIFVLGMLLNVSQAGDFVVSLESSGEYLAENTVSVDDIDSYTELFNGSRWERFEVIRHISNCTVENCDSLFMSPIFETRDKLIEEFGEEKGHSHFLLTLAGMIASGNNTLSSIAYDTAKFSLDFNEKVFIAQSLGDIMLSNYDDARTDTENAASNGVVNQDQLFEGIRNDIDAGVCRDISTAQAQVLQGLGVDNVYVIAFATFDSGHATVMAQDNEDPSRIVHLNYGEATAQYLNSDLFNQNTTLPNNGTVVQIYNADGEALDVIPSEVGHVLLQTAGMDVKDFGAGINRRGIRTISVDYLTGGMSFSVTASKTAAGNEILSAGANIVLANSKYVESNVGVAISASKNNQFERSLNNMGVILATQTRLKSGKVDFGILKRSYVSLDVTSNVYFGRSTLTTPDVEKESNVFDSLVRVTSSMHTDVDITKNILLRSSVGLHGTVMNGDVRDEGSLGFVYTGATISNSVLVDISEKYAAEFENIIYLRKGSKTMSNTFYLKTKDGKRAVEVGLDSPLSENPHPWMVGVTKELRVGYEQNTEHISFDIKYTRLLDLEEDFVNFGIKGIF